VSVTNTHRVPVKTWRKWSEASQAVFLKVYGQMRAQPEYFWHPKAPAVGAAHWKTTAWNAAWIAAEAVDGRGGRLGDAGP
jgi:hypothetical protein